MNIISAYNQVHPNLPFSDNLRIFSPAQLRRSCYQSLIGICRSYKNIYLEPRGERNIAEARDLQMKMRRPKKEGNHHLLSAFATQTIATLISKLKECMNLLRLIFLDMTTLMPLRNHLTPSNRWYT